MSALELADNALYGVVTTFSLYTYIGFLFRANRLIEFIDQIKDYTNFGEPPQLKHLIRTQNKNMKYIYFYTFVSTLMYSFVSYLENDACEYGHSCTFVLPIWLPDNLKEVGTVKILCWIYQNIVVLMILLPSVTGTYFGACITQHVTVRVVHLRSLMAKASKEINYKTKMRKLMYCIKYHIYIVR